MRLGSAGNLRWVLEAEIDFSGEWICVEVRSHFELIGKIEECFNEDLHIFSIPREAEKGSVYEAYFWEAGQNDLIPTGDISDIYFSWNEKLDNENGELHVCIDPKIKTLPWSPGAVLGLLVRYKKTNPPHPNSESFDVPVSVKFPFYEHMGALNLDKRSEEIESFYLKISPPENCDWESIEKIRGKIFESLGISMYDRNATCNIENRKIIFVSEGGA